MPAVHVATQTNPLCSVDVDRLKSVLACLVSCLEQLGTAEKSSVPQPAVLAHCRKLAEESIHLLDTIYLDGGGSTSTNEALKESTSLAHIGKSTAGRCSVHFADKAQNGEAGSAQTSSEDSDSDDEDLLPAPPTTEPGILRYHGEQDMVLHLPKIVTNAPVMAMGLDGDIFCEFCGSELVQSSGSDGSMESSGEELEYREYCCHDRKRLCRLVARYSQKLSKAAAAEGAKRIDISPGKKARKEEAKRRALEKLKARKLQKQRELKLLGIGGSMQSSSFHSLARQTKTIAFSLSEPNAAQENWILDTPNEEDQLQSALPGYVVKRKEDVGSFKTGNRQRRRRRRGKTSDEEDEDDMVTWLKQWYVEPSMQPLKMVKYYSGIDFQICHSDGTGQCYYPTGNTAVLVTAMSPGILSHYVFPDDKLPIPHVLAYFDDLGRGFSYYERSQDLRLFYGPEGGLWLSERGSVKKNWEWVDDTAFIQPLVLSLNANITLKITSQNNITLTVSANPRCPAKFSVGQKLTPPPCDSNQKHFTTHLEEYLKDRKAHANSLLAKLQQAARSVSRGTNATKSGVGDRSSGNNSASTSLATAVLLPPLQNTHQKAARKK